MGERALDQAAVSHDQNTSYIQVEKQKHRKAETRKRRNGCLDTATMAIGPSRHDDCSRHSVFHHDRQGGPLAAPAGCFEESVGGDEDEYEGGWWRWRGGVGLRTGVISGGKRC